MKNSKNYPWILVGLLWVVALLNYMDRQMLSTMKPSMMIDIAELQTATNFGRLMAIFLWIYGFMSPVAGMIADKFNRKWLIVGSLFVWSGVTFAMGYAQTFDQLYWLRAIMGVSEALYFAIPSLPGWGIKNWLPTLFANNLDIDMSEAGPLSTITIAASSFLGVIFGGILSDRWVQKNIRGRIYTSAIGLALTIPALLLIGYGHSLFHVVGAAFCFGFGFGMFDANNMPILCQFVSSRYRATAYGLMNMVGVFAGAFITDLLGKSTDAGNLGKSFAMLSGIVAVALVIQLFFLRPKANDFVDAE